MVCWRDNKEASVAGAQRMKGRVMGADIREVPKDRACRAL